VWIGNTKEVMSPERIRRAEGELLQDKGPDGLIARGFSKALDMSLPGGAVLPASSAQRSAMAEETVASFAPELHQVRGYERLYRDHVEQADTGCDFDFLRTAR
jgi:dihydroxy-acid dehydratase